MVGRSGHRWLRVERCEELLELVWSELVEDILNGETGLRGGETGWGNGALDRLALLLVLLRLVRLMFPNSGGCFLRGGHRSRVLIGGGMIEVGGGAIV